MSAYSTIMRFLSSSEINRCRKNNLQLWEARETWFQVLKYPWLTRKLRRKIGHMIQLDILPVIRRPLIGLSTDHEALKELSATLAKMYLDAEDKAILGGDGL